MGKITYKHIGDRDLSDVKVLLRSGSPSMTGRLAQLGGITRHKDDRKMMSVLREYYYDINYPGEECRELDPEEAAEAVAFAERFIGQIKFAR